MPNIRVRLADDNPLLTPAGSFRLMETLAPGAIPAFPKATCLMIHDAGWKEGARTAYLATSPELVAEMLLSDPSFGGKLCEVDQGDGRKLWFLGSQVETVTGVNPPGDDELAELATVAETQDTDEARQALEARKTFVGRHTRLDLALYDALGAHRYTYWLTDAAEAVIELVAPETAKPAPPEH